jgi:hypothetical protein
LEGKAIHIPDVLADPEYRATPIKKWHPERRTPTTVLFLDGGRSTRVELGFPRQAAPLTLLVAPRFFEYPAIAFSMPLLTCLCCPSGAACGCSAPKRNGARVGDFARMKAGATPLDRLGHYPDALARQVAAGSPVCATISGIERMSRGWNSTASQALNRTGDWAYSEMRSCFYGSAFDDRVPIRRPPGCPWLPSRCILWPGE